jgi:hypothetical protein
VAAALAALGTHEINAQIKGLDRMLRVSDHIHDQNPRLVKPIDDPPWRHADGRHEQARAGLDGDVDELVELAVGVVVVRGAGAASDLGEGEVDTEGEGRVAEGGFELGDDLAELVGGVLEAADDAEAAGVGDGGGEGAA